MRKDKDVVDAKVVAIDSDMKPIESVVVGDKRDNLGRRLSLFGIILLLLFFAISSYIQAFRNQHLLEKAAKERVLLVDSNNKIANSLHQLVKDNNKQARQINRLQNALHKQNKLLKAHGLKTIIIPAINTSTPRQPNDPRNHKSTKHAHYRHKKSHGHHSPNPSPTSTPVNQQVCDKVGVCIKLIERTNDHASYRETLRRVEVYCSSGSASGWSIIFCDLTDLGIAKRE